VREALADRFKGIPDVHYGDNRHWVAADMGVSEWTLTGTTTSGVSLKVRGCDLWEFRNGKVVRKDFLLENSRALSAVIDSLNNDTL
jgi:SnoaL-like domain